MPPQWRLQTEAKPRFGPGREESCHVFLCRNAVCVRSVQMQTQNGVVGCQKYVHVFTLQDGYDASAVGDLSRAATMTLGWKVTGSVFFRVTGIVVLREGVTLE